MLLLLIGMIMAKSSLGQTAHQYYDEIYQAGGLDRVADSYVCFADDADSNTFFLVSQSNLVREAMMNAGVFSQLSLASQLEMKKDFLILRGYVKGVPHPAREFMDRDGGSYVSEGFQLGSVRARLRMTIVWETLRYKRVIEPVRSNTQATAPFTESFGRCERVSPDVRQNGQ